MHGTHIFHAYIALHKSDLPAYIAIIGSGLIRLGRPGAAYRSSDRTDGKAEWSTARHDAARPGRRKGIDGIRSGALLLPAPFRYDWQHSSSRLPINFSDARRISSPGGRHCFSAWQWRKRRGLSLSAPASAKKLPIFQAASAHRHANPCRNRMRAMPSPVYRAMPSSPT